jgi:hypothetical protein
MIEGKNQQNVNQDKKRQNNHEDEYVDYEEVD